MSGFLRGLCTTLDSVKCSFFVLSLAYLGLCQCRVTSDSLGVGGHRCGAFMSPIFRDPHPICARCRGIKCTADVTCDICKDWSVAQWEAFLKGRPYSGRRKKRPSGSALSPASQTPPPSASAFFRSRPPSATPPSF